MYVYMVTKCFDIFDVMALDTNETTSVTLINNDDTNYQGSVLNWANGNHYSDYSQIYYSHQSLLGLTTATMATTTPIDKGNDNNNDNNNSNRNININSNNNKNNNSKNSNSNDGDYYRQEDKFIILSNCENDHNLQAAFDQDDTTAHRENNNINKNDNKNDNKILSMNPNPYETQQENIIQEGIIQKEFMTNNNYDDREKYGTINNYSLDDKKILSDSKRSMQMLTELEQRGAFIFIVSSH